MRTSIKINDQYIQKILLGSTPVQRIYQSGSIVYEAGGSTPCFEVVDTISEASGNYVDVYAWDTEKWYKKNNLSQFEEYGIMPTVDSLTGVTTYTGKLVILSTDNHEYKWNGSSWVDLGECDVTVIHSPEYISRTSSYTGYVPLGDKFQENTVIEIDFQMTNDRGYAVIGDYWGDDNDDWRFFVNYSDGGYNGVSYDFDTTRIQTTVSNTKARFHLEIGNYYAKYYGASSNLITGTRKTNFDRPNQMYIFHMDGPISQVNEDYGNVYMLKITQDGVLSKDFIPWTDMNGNYGFYDLLSNTVYPSTGNMTGSNNVTDIQISCEPIEDYPTKVAPADNVHYNTLAELELMECPWNGMQATVGPNYEHYVYWNNQWNKESIPCFEVVETISETSGDYVDVYALDTKKWYKHNNLSQYEEYGVIEHTDDLSELTYYTGKLVILDTTNHEYKWNGTTWADLGECEREAVLPNGYTQYPAIANNGNAYINSGYIPSNNTRILADMQITTSTTYGRLWGSGQWNVSRSIQLDYENGTTGTIHGKWGTENTWNINSNVRGDFDRHVYDMYDHYLYRDGELVLTFASGTFTSQYNLAIFTYYNHGTPGSSEWINGRLYSFKIYDNGTLVRDFIPCKRDSDSKAGVYDIVNDVFYPSSSSNQFSTYGDPYTPLIPVEEYDTKVAPPNDVHYNTLAELELMECPWIGMTATIGVNYVPYIYTNLGWIRKS